MDVKILYWNCAAGLLKKIDYLREVAMEMNADIIFISECEVKNEFDLGFLALEGYETCFAKTLLSRNKARLMCFRKPCVKLIDITDELNDIIVVEMNGVMVCGAYRGFKCFEGESEIKNWERMVKDFEKLNYQKEVVIVGDLNIDPTKETYLCKELLNFCDSKGLSIVDRGITRARLVAGTMQESCLDLIINNSDKTSLQKEFNELSDHCVLKIKINKFGKVIRESKTLDSWIGALTITKPTLFLVTF